MKRRKGKGTELTEAHDKWKTKNVSENSDPA
jgi:hypothetical protein